ncbi:uncharacterized protein LOC128739573 [Sabethes cyaneus]|uniref:uncharacterized protein LOC128739573 n=1 Tax=Sabethes cyaneus TaxID=53552 RepID=UPI00237DD117|nr:uncharacterized protein LOC128739573 [Sabethes cyaneus]
MLITKGITTKYGQGGKRILKMYSKLSTKMAKTNNRVKFLLNCRKCKVIPKCLNYRVRLNLNSDRSQRELDKMLFKHKIRILSIMIADAKRTIVELKRQQAFLQHQMFETFEEVDVRKVEKMVENKSVVVHQRVEKREKKKVAALKMRKIEALSGRNTWIENTTNTPIPDYLERTLKLGPNFNIQNQSKTPYVEMIAEVENAIKFKDAADEIRTDVAMAMINHINFQKQPRHHELEWINKDILKSGKFLAENPNILVTKADKGNKTVIISSSEYQEKMESLLDDETTYKKIKGDPTAKILKKISVLIDGWRENKYIEPRTHRKLKVTSGNPPRIYGLPKIHKQDRPLRPVVSTIGSATYNMAQYLAEIIGHIVGKTDFHVRNSFEFAEQITGKQIPEDTILFSLDVTSLYTNIPVEYAIDCLTERWDEISNHTKIDCHSFISAVKLVLDSTFFAYRGSTFSQCFGLPMGSPLSPVIANVVMEKLEQHCVTELESKNISLSMYRRYVDDCFCVASNEHVNEILNTFNSFHNRLQFTIEIEQSGSLKFLDMLLKRNNDRIEKTWAPKQEDGRYLDFASQSPYAHKCNTAIAIFDRALKLSDCQNRPAAIKMAKNILRINHYPTWFVRKILADRVHKLYNSLQATKQTTSEVRYVSTPYIPGLSEKLKKILHKHNTELTFKPQDKIRNRLFSKLKDPVPPGKQRNVVYSIPCGTDDGKVYIGQTGRKVETRVAEHKNDAKKGEAKSGLSQHTVEEGHLFDFAKTRVLERIENQETRTTAEMFHIKILGDSKTVNLQRECGTFNAAYNGLVLKLRQSNNNKPRFCPFIRSQAQEVTVDTQSVNKKITIKRFRFPPPSAISNYSVV